MAPGLAPRIAHPKACVVVVRSPVGLVPVIDRYEAGSALRMGFTGAAGGGGGGGAPMITPWADAWAAIATKRGRGAEGEGGPRIATGRRRASGSVVAGSVSRLG